MLVIFESLKIRICVACAVLHTLECLYRQPIREAWGLGSEA